MVSLSINYDIMKQTRVF